MINTPPAKVHQLAGRIRIEHPNDVRLAKCTADDT